MLVLVIMILTFTVAHKLSKNIYFFASAKYEKTIKIYKQVNMKWV